MTQEIRGLTLRHPWAWAFLHGKDVENRTWQPERQGGKVGMYLALHGGALPKRSDDDYIEEIAHALEWIDDQGVFPPTVELPDFGHYYQPNIIRGVSPCATPQNTAPFCLPGIIAVAQIVDVRQDSPSPWAAEGQWHWCLKVTPLPEPVPHRGAQGLWTLEPDALARVRAGYRTALQPERTG